jgi:hypothetical protein
LRSRFANNVNSWIGYDNWANCPSGISEEYLIDDKTRLIDSSAHNNEGLNCVDGISALRRKLLQNNSSTRLVGLSGVGKTRFAQALFDTRIGENAIPAENVFYTDIANGPSPTPRVLAEKLVSEGKCSQLVVDNCPPELHRALTTICTSEASKVNLLTIEYDIREDQPEQTDVFSLEPSSVELIEKILIARYRTLGQQNSRTISEFSGGNSRIAIALAEMIDHDENISSLKDEELFKRLFHQRHNQDKSLEKIAQVLSLVYSFQINSDISYSEDVIFISNLSEIPPKNIYEAAIDLKRRSLVQQRSKWMAVLPHPIANRLAKYALENISPAVILSKFNETIDERLLKSFSRRLGYLPNCNEAKIIIQSWFSAGGLLENLHSNNRNALAWVVIENIAPISVEKVLIYIEKFADQPEFCTRNNESFIGIIGLIRSIAYEGKYFNQCTNLLCQFSLSERKEENNNSIRDVLNSLFQLYLSGTHATKEQRLKVIDDLINTSIESNVDLALELLNSSLEASHFSSSHSFDFGANSRDYGYSPKSNQDVNEWYTLYINYIVKLITNDSSNSIIAKEKLSNNLRGLWQQHNLRDLIEETCLAVGNLGMWSDGFSEIHSILKFDCKASDIDEIERLQSIANKLSPKSLIDDINMYVLADKWGFYELEELSDTGGLTTHGYEKGQEYAKELGCKLTSTDNELLKRLLTDLLSYDGNSSNLFEFGKGAAEGCKNSSELLAMTESKLEQLSEKERNIDFLCGQINYFSKHNIKLSNEFLDKIIVNDKLKQYFPIVQLSCTLDKNSIDRIIIALKMKTSPIWMYRNLGSGRRHEPISDAQLCDILDLIWQQNGGQAVAVELLTMRFHALDQNQDYIVSDMLKSKSASFLASFDYSKDNNNSNGSDYNLTNIANACFSKNENNEYAIIVLNDMKSKILGHIIGRYDFPEFMSTMIQLHPILALDIFIGDGEEVDYKIKNSIKNRLDKKISPFSKVDTKKLIAWCEQSKEDRYPKLASIITCYRFIEKTIEWTPLAIELLKESADPIKILEGYSENLNPTSCTGSRAKNLESKLPLFKILKQHNNKEISSWAINKEMQWDKIITEAYRREVERDSERNERFEW